MLFGFGHSVAPITLHHFKPPLQTGEYAHRIRTSDRGRDTNAGVLIWRFRSCVKTRHAEQEQHTPVEAHARASLHNDTKEGRFTHLSVPGIEHGGQLDLYDLKMCRMTDVA